MTSHFVKVLIDALYKRALQNSTLLSATARVRTQLNKLDPNVRS